MSTVELYNGRQSFDIVAWDKNDDVDAELLLKLRLKTTCRKVEALVARKLGKLVTLVKPIIVGGFNVHYRIRLDGEDASSDVMVRLPWPNDAYFPSEKVFYEAATSEFMRMHTRLPTAPVLFHGEDPDLGPFLILRRIENKGDMVDPLAVPERDPSDTPVLNEELEDDTLRALWGDMAWCLMELARPTFSSIGSLTQVENSFQVAARPITQNMNSMMSLGNIPSAVLPDVNRTYATTDEWFVTLADMHLSQLTFQHNDLVTSEDDCRNKYVARQIFRRLAKLGRLSSFGFKEDEWSASSAICSPALPAPGNSGPFRLWCDDFRPANALLAPEGGIAAVIDWEFAYAAPTHFALDPPWWLLLETPEMWSSDIQGWRQAYDAKLKVWLEAMEEQEALREPLKIDGVQLSEHMRESWRTGRFWLNYAARKSWAFDAVYWTYLDELFFGRREDGTHDLELWKTRLDRLTEDERLGMEPFVQRKMDESRERVLVEWDVAEAKKRLSEVLFE